MTHRHTLSISILALAAAATPALAGKGDPKSEPTESKEAFKRLLDTSFRADYVTDDFDHVPLEELEPEHCADPLHAGTTFAKELLSTSVAGLPFSVVAEAGIGLVAESGRFGASASIGPTIQFGGMRIAGEDKLKPIELRFDAITESGQSSLSASLYAFGYQIDTYDLANTTQPISYHRFVGYDLPTAGFTGGWRDDAACPLVSNCRIEYDLSYGAVAEVAAILLFDVSPAGVRTGVLATANAYAHLNASAGIVYDEDPSDGKTDFELEIESSGRFDIFHTIFGGRGRILPYNGHWLADAAATLSVSDTMQSSFQLTFDVPDWLPGIPDEIVYRPYDRTGVAYADDWSYQCTFE